MKKLTKLQHAEQIIAAKDVTIALREARIRVLEGQVARLNQLNDQEHARRETLGSLVGKFKANVSEFYRVFDTVMER